MSRGLRLFEPTLLVLILLGAWEAACRLSGVPAYLVPPPSAVLAELAGSFSLLVLSAGVTLARALFALVLCFALATGLALLVALSPRAEALTRPLTTAVQVTPIIAIAPLVVIWAGLDHAERAVTALAVATAFYPVYSGVLTGLKSQDPDLQRLFDLYGAGRWKTLLRLRLPSAIPFMVEGLRVGAGLAVVGAVMAEFVAGSGETQGLAWRLLEAGNRLQTARVFAALFMLAAMGGALHIAMAAGERKILHWWRGR